MLREWATAKALCGWLGELPLAIELVGRHLRRHRYLSLKELFEQLQDQHLEAEPIDRRDAGYEMTATQGVRAAFELTWQDLDEAAQEAGMLMGLFAPEVILWVLVEQMLGRVHGEDFDANPCRDALVNGFVVKPLGEEGQAFVLHPLVREFVREKLRQAEKQEVLKRAFVDQLVDLAKNVPQQATQDFIQAFSFIRPHWEVIADSFLEMITEVDLILPFVALIRFYKSQGLYALAEPWCSKSLDTVRQRLGEEHPYVATSLNNLAEIYRSQGRYETAAPIHLQALEKRKTLLGEEHLCVATSLNNLALSYKDQGQYEESEPLLIEALEMRRLLLGEKHLDVAESLNNLAELYRSQGKYEESEPLLIEALEMRRLLLGEKHLDVAVSLNNLALWHESQGKYEKAEPLLIEALEMRRLLLGEKHPSVALSLNNLSVHYAHQEQFSKAIPLIEKALERYLSIWGEKHPTTTSTRKSLVDMQTVMAQQQNLSPRSCLLHNSWQRRALFFLCGLALALLAFFLLR